MDPFSDEEEEDAAGVEESEETGFKDVQNR